MPAPLAAFFVVLFIAYLSLFPMAAGWLQARLSSPGKHRLLFVIPASWVLAEWFRGWLLTGFPWLHLGYSQSDSVLMNLAPLIGVYGMSLVVAVLASLLVLALGSQGRVRVASLCGLTALIIVAWLAGRIDYAAPDGEKVRLALLQGNVPLHEKWKEGASQKIISHYLALSRDAVEKADVIIWPEGAVPDTWQRASYLIETSLPRRQDGVMPEYMIGTIDAPRVNGSPGGSDYYNAAVTVSESNGSRQRDIYRKVHLVPFGEFLPLKPLLGWVIEYLKIPMSDFSSWEGSQPDVQLAGRPVAVSICYEDAFGEELTGTVENAAFLVNLSEDAWFGDSLAPHQRMQMARIRAREFGRYFVRAANTGITAIINERGEVTDSLKQFETAVLIADVAPMTGVTPYVRFGNSIFLVVLILWMLPGVITKAKEGS